MKKWNEQIMDFNTSLSLEKTQLPKEVEVLNPFKGDHADFILKIGEEFYSKFYSDSKQRKLILGINPGRLGAGSTGIPFSDTKRLAQYCDIHIDSFSSHEPSSEFVYKVIEQFGGAKSFYQKFYIGSVCPLGFTKLSNSGKQVNYNYYDSTSLERAVRSFIVESIEKQLSFGVDRAEVFCFGTGKNYKYLKSLNDEHQWFDAVVALEHPRYVMQYKRKELEFYIDKYIKLLGA